MIDFLKSILPRFGFKRREYVSPFVDSDGWERHSFYTEDKRKTEKLAALARYRGVLKDLIVTKKRQKKKTSHIEKAVRDAMTETLEIESGARVFNGTAWTRCE